MEAKAKANGPSSAQSGRVIEGPTNPMVTPLLTDLYQFTMAYAYWKAGKHQERAVWVFIFGFFIQYSGAATYSESMDIKTLQNSEIFVYTELHTFSILSLVYVYMRKLP